MRVLRSHPSLSAPVLAGVLLAGLLLFLANHAAAAPTACVPGPHSGVITGTQTWCAADSPHLLSGDVTVPPGVTLTIESGVTVMGDSGFSGAELRVEGTLQALGTVTRPITFTSIADTGPYQWSGLAFDGGTGDLRYVTVRYAGQYNSVLDGILGSYQGSDLAARDSTLHLEHVTFRDVAGNNRDHGLVVADSRVVMSDTLFTGIGGGSYVENERPMVVGGGATDLVMHGSVFTGNNADRVQLLPGAMMGHDATLYAQPQLEGYEFQETFTVPPTYTLALEPGVTVMGGDDQALKVQGHLEAVGTPTMPITFTSSSGGVSGWEGLIFDGSLGAGTGNLRYVTVMHGGDQVYPDLPGADQSLGGNIYVRDVLSGAVRLEYTQIISETGYGAWAFRARDYGLFVDNSRVVVSGTLFSEIGDGEASTGTDEDFPLHVSGPASVLTLTNTTFQDNHVNRILLWPGAMMGHDAALPTMPTLEGYELAGDFTVPPTYTLTLDPGVTVMGRWDNELRVEGRLEAIGTPARPITFTSSVNTGACQWQGLVFDGGAGDLRYATVRYAGRGNSVLTLPSTGYHDGANITIHNVLTGEVHLEHVTVSDEYHFDGWHFFLDHGIYIENSRVSIADSLIASNGDDTTADSSFDSGIFVTGDSEVLIENSRIQANSGVGLLVEGDEAFVAVHGSAIENNVRDGVRNRGRATLILGGDESLGNSIQGNQGYGVNQEVPAGQTLSLYRTLAFYNWWGDASGPTHSGNPGGTGEEVTDQVFYDPWLTAAPAPPTTTQYLVQLAAPQRVAAGDTVNFGVSFQNLYTATLHDAIVVLEIPWRAEYRYSVPDGEFWPLQNRVIWKLGDVPVGGTFHAVVQVWYKWGTPAYTVMPAVALVAADNLRHPWVSYDEHLAYEELDIAARQPLTQTQVDAILAADPDLAALYNHLIGQGFEYYGNAEQLTLDDGTEWVELLLLNPDRLGEIAAVRRIGDDRHIRRETDTSVEFYDLEGGARFDYLTAGWEFWGNLAASAATSTTARCSGASAEGTPRAMAGPWPDAQPYGADACPDQDWGDCLRNCLLQQVPQEMSNPSLAGGSHACQACVACSSDCLGVCSQCARDLWAPYHQEHYRQCTQACADVHNWNKYRCDGDSVACYDAPRNESKFGRSEFRLTYHCDGNTCKYMPTPSLEYCPHGCAYGDSETLGGINTQCIDCSDTKDWHTWQICTRELLVHDPNALHGPQTAAPGQTLTYTVEWENTGEGTAHGVYVESTLPPEVDDTTLQVGGGGTYYPSLRTILWEVGDLAGGAGDSVTYTVRVPSTVISGTLLTAQAVVYFPSVPETTPTNPVVTLIQDLAAHGQEVETVEGTPVTITLRGDSPSGGPLTYQVVGEPAHGVLTGSPPHLTYTPEVNFEGADGFEFTVGDGTRTSLPAQVTLIVRPGDETIPPEIALTLPRAGESDVWVSDTPLYDDVYQPDILAYATEPLEASTVTTTVVSLRAADGYRPEFDLAYDEYLQAIRLTLHEPLHRNETYVVTITTGLRDTSGNALAETYTWQFSTWGYKVYLPVVMR